MEGLCQFPVLFSIVANSHVTATRYTCSIYFSILGPLILFLTFEAGVFNLAKGNCTSEDLVKIIIRKFSENFSIFINAFELDKLSMQS
jgi:hypothetical protein